MTTEDSRAIVMEFLELGARGELEACFALFTDDAVWSNIGSTRFSGDFRGKQAILEGLIGPLFAQLQGGIESEVEAVIADGDHVVVLSRGRALTVSGREYNNTYAQVFTLGEGKIKAVREYMDTAMIDALFGSAA